MFLDDVAQRASEIDVSKITRPDLGQLGMPVLALTISKVRKELDVIRSVADDCSEEALAQAVRSYSTYVSTLSDMQSLTGQEYANQRQILDEKLGEQWNALRDAWPPFAALAFDKSGLIDSRQNMLLEMRELAENTQSDIQKVVRDLTDKAQVEADRIEERARGTARGFSVKAAQIEFDTASNQLRQRAIGWGVLSLAVFVGFIGFALNIYHHPPIFFSEQRSSSSNLVAEAIYFSAIRVTILTAIGALATFCLRMLRAHLHMSAQNDHRRRVANSMEAFVEAAQTPEQRDIIFGRLVDSVVDFGESGILEKTGDTLSVPSVAIEAVTKNLMTKG